MSHLLIGISRERIELNIKTDEGVRNVITDIIGAGHDEIGGGNMDVGM